MVVLRLKSPRRRYHALLCLSIAGFIIYHHLGYRTRHAERREGLRGNASQFTLDGRPFRVLGGAIHYYRVPRAYWRDRMLKLKACGLNTLTTMVPWNLHEPQRGVFTFNRQLDLEAYIALAEDLGLWVILCPGPYIGSEWDLGGLPSWLLSKEDMKLRTSHADFTDAVNAFFDKLIPKVVPLQFTKGGAVIAVQVEHEYGSYAQDQHYMEFVKEALTSRGISELLLTSDSQMGLARGGVSGALQTISLQRLNRESTKYLDVVQPDSARLVMHYSTGGYDAWGELHHVFAAEDMVAMVRRILRQGMSVNLHVFHGGTNFGFTGGAAENPSHKSLVTSYDFDAPLSESGEYTVKYHLLRDLFSRYQKGEKLLEMPVLQAKEAYEAAVMYQHLSLWDALPFTAQPCRSARPLSMERLPVRDGNGQSCGYVLYETTISSSGGTLYSRNNVRDRALVFVDRRLIGIFSYKNLKLAVPNGKGQRTLSLLVENLGRASSGLSLDQQHKGLVGDVLLNKSPLRDFIIYSLELKPSFIDSLHWAPWKFLPSEPSFPSFFQGRLFVDGYPSDTFLKMTGWMKGVVFINGQNLGRYWSQGPQEALYLPGPWLNGGINQVMVFEEQETDFKVQFENVPDLGMSVEL